jgi:hypothetical protein
MTVKYWTHILVDTHKFHAQTTAMDTSELTLNIDVNELKKIAHIPDEQVRKELLEILEMCGIPEEKASLFEYALREYIRDIIRREGLPEDKWLIDALYNIYIHITYATTTVLGQCIFKEDLLTYL